MKFYIFKKVYTQFLEMAGGCILLILCGPVEI